MKPSEDQIHKAREVIERYKNHYIPGLEKNDKFEIFHSNLTGNVYVKFYQYTGHGGVPEQKEIMIEIDKENNEKEFFVTVKRFTNYADYFLYMKNFKNSLKKIN